ncbi:MAG: ABC transporter ATP-binding protein [Pseudonocardia sp.]
MSRIGCRDLRVTVGERTLLHIDTLDVAPGELLAVLGPNGAGKSTLLRALGLLSNHRVTGHVLLDGRPATRATARTAIAAVLQRPILRRGTVAANAASGLRLRGVRRAEATRRAAPWLAALGVDHLARRDARTLSGGEAQRIALARALAVRPRVLLLDEPFAALDATSRADLLADLRAVLDDLDTATLFVTHDRHEAVALAPRAALLVGGRIRQLGATADVLDQPADPDCARLVGFTNLGDGIAARPEDCELLAPGARAPADGVALPGTVRRIVPLGVGVRVDVTTAAGPWACLVTGTPDHAPGDAVVVAAHRVRRLHRLHASPLRRDGTQPTSRASPARSGKK